MANFKNVWLDFRTAVLRRFQASFGEFPAPGKPKFLMARETIQKLPQNPQRSGSSRRPGLQAENETTPRSLAFAVENFEFVIPDVCQPVGPAALRGGGTDR